MGRFVDRVWPGSPSGQTRAARTPCKYRAYVPEAISELDLALPARLAADLADAERALIRLNTDHPDLANLEPLARFLLRTEAVASSWMEGLSINVRRLAKQEAAEREGIDSGDHTARAVYGNIKSLDAALTLAGRPGAPVAVTDILDIHRALLTGTRDARWAGVVRTEQNWVGGLNPCRAAYVPPPPEELPALLDDLAAYLSSDDHPALMQAALAHAQFETIHPFADGNGRAGRALIQLVLRRRGLAEHVVPPVSLALASNADRYVDALMATRVSGNAADGYLLWLEVFTEAATRACARAGDFARELAALEADSRSALAPVRANSAVELIVHALPALPVFSAKTMAEHIGRSHVAVNAALERLVAAGVVRQVDLARRRHRAFEATAILEAFTGFEHALGTG